jgi:hypothetical protein
MGGYWRLPTSTNVQELIDNTNYEFVTINGMSGGKFTNKIDPRKYIFLPAGFYRNGELYLGNESGCWSSNLAPWSTYAYGILGASFGAFLGQGDRYYGKPLRGVIDKVNNGTNTTVEVNETSINLLSNVEVTEDSITLLGNNIKIDSDENNNYNIIIE